MGRLRERAPAPTKPVQQEDEETEEEPQRQDRLQETDVDQGSRASLQFREPLTWRAGQPIPVSDLLRRLKALYTEISQLEQGEVKRAGLVPLAKVLSNAQLLHHKDKGVKSWTVLCVARMMYLLAPSAPYTDIQLRDIFAFVASQLIPALATSGNPYHQQHMATLSSMTTDKSVIMILDIPTGEKLAAQLFASCFDLLAGNVKGATGEKIQKNVEYQVTSLLTTVIDTTEKPIPTGVVDVVLAQFLRADPGSIGSDENMETHSPADISPAYKAARSICNSCATKMVGPVGQYFSSVLIDASDASEGNTVARPRGRKGAHDDSDDDDLDEGPGVQDEIHEAARAHKLLREIWRSSPDVVQGVIPQIEAELGADNLMLRTMAVQTTGDMIAGVGAAGPPQATPLDPAAWPPQSLDLEAARTTPKNAWLRPNAPYAFSSIYAGCYQAFVERRRDKYPVVRAAWATAVGRILSTAAGGKGLDPEQEADLLRFFAQMLMDTDEHVRLAAVRAIESFDFPSIVERLSKKGGVAVTGSVLFNLAARIKDPRQNVHAAAINLLGRMWGVAAGAIADGQENIREIFGAIPSRILDAVYVNTTEINSLVLSTLYESLLPVNFPPFKAKSLENGHSEQSENGHKQAENEPDPDAIRALRILVLVRDLEQKAKPVFFRLQKLQPGRAKYLISFLDHCEKVSSDKSNKASRQMLDKLIDIVAKNLPDAQTASDHLKLFAKHEDRRSYTLLRFCFAPESDYRKITKAIKELTKRLREAKTPIPSVLETLMPLLRPAALLVYNRSHFPAFAEFARTDDKGLGTSAHEVLKDIASVAPEVFKVHVLELCQTLKKQMPSASAPNDPAAVDTLKACADFSRRFPDGMPKDRAFYQAMTAFALHGSPPEVAKYAVTVIVTSAEKKEMYVRSLLSECIQNFGYGVSGFLSRLAALSQLRLLAQEETEDESDAIASIAIGDILSPVRTPADDDDPQWSTAADQDDDLTAKLWAMKILVNGLRGRKVSEEATDASIALKSAADPVYKMLNTLIHRDGELSKSAPTARHHRAHLRLAAGLSLLKLSCNRTLDTYLSPVDFNRLSKLCQDPLPEVRAGFAKGLKKYLGQGRLPTRFYALVFLYAFEPSKGLKASTETWIKARAELSISHNDTVIESVFARLLSLLTHHQDFSRQADDLRDHAEYVLFYLKIVARQANLPLIYHLAQRMKTVRDGISEAKSEDLYLISDLAETTIRAFQDEKGWTLPVFEGKMGLPSAIFRPLPSRSVAQELAEKRFLSDEVAEQVQDLVKAGLRPPKRKATQSSEQSGAKKARTSTVSAGKGKTNKSATSGTKKAAKPARTTNSRPSKKESDAAAGATPDGDRRRSVRNTAASTNYVENESDDDDEELERWNEAGDAGDRDDEDKENHDENMDDAPPPSEPALDSSAGDGKGEVLSSAKESDASNRPRKGTKRAAARGKKPDGAVKAGRTRASKRDVFDVANDSS